MRTHLRASPENHEFLSLFFIQLLALFIILGLAVQVLAASFIADFVKEEDGKTEIWEFFLLDDQYRMDGEEDGVKGTVLVDRVSGKTRIVVHDEKGYVEINNRDFWSLLNNPFEGYEMMLENYENRSEGSETIDGIDCNKVIFSIDGKDVVTAWMAEPYEFLIRLENHENGYIYALKNIRETPLDESFFEIPAGYDKMENLEQESSEGKQPEASKVSAITGEETFNAPIGRRIGAGGKLRVKVVPENEIVLALRNQNQGESLVTVTALKDNSPVSNPELTNDPIKFETLWDDKEIDFTDIPNPEALLISVAEGLIYAEVTQESSLGATEDVEENFLREPALHEFLIRPELNVKCTLVGNSQDVSESNVKVQFFKDEYNVSAHISEFSLKNGQSKEWVYKAGQIGSGKVEVLNGAVQFSLHQTSSAKNSKAATKATEEKQSTHPVKLVNTFTVEHPYGTSKPLDPNKGLVITVTGITNEASGTIELYTDRGKNTNVETFKFNLKEKKSESFTLAKEKNAGWATVWVHDGVFKVKLDQSPQSTEAAPLTETSHSSTASSNKTEQSTSGDLLFNEEVPLMSGAKILKERINGLNGQVDFEVPAPPQQILDFYQKEMTAKGWQSGMAVIQGQTGMIQLIKGKSQIMLKAQGNEQKSIVNFAMITQ